MATRTTSGRVIESPALVELKFPAIDIPTYIFQSGDETSRKSPQFFDVADPNSNFNLEDAAVYVKRFARGLQDLGLGRDDKVLLCSSNQLYFPIVLWGVLAAGCVFTGASPTVSEFELSYQMEDSEAKIILAAPEQLNVALKAAAKSGIGPEKVFIFTTPLMSNGKTAQSTWSVKHWTDIWATPHEVSTWSWRRISTLAEAQATTAVINYSSGTTGLPKGVELSHFNLVSNVEQIIYKRALVGASEFGRNRAAQLSASGERWLAPLPMYHAFGQTYYSMIAPRVGAKVFVMGKFNLTKYLTYIDIYQITFINVVPTLIQMISEVRAPGRFNLKSLSMVGSGSAPLNTDTARKVERMFFRPGLQIKQGWGLTETACNVTGFSPDDLDDGRSIGWLNPGCRAQIVPIPERDFSSLEREKSTTVGEIWIAGPNVMKGYWKKANATAEVLVKEAGHKWLRTGDIGYFDERGCLYIVDRIKELIKVKGLQVSPAELEQGLLSHPGVLEAAVVGVKISEGEAPRAFVVRKDAIVTEQTLHDLINARFAKHKWLTGGIYFLDSLPRTGSGKVIKRALQIPNEKRQTKL